MLVIFVLGSSFDTFEIIFIVVPIAATGAHQARRGPGLARRDDRREPADQLPTRRPSASRCSTCAASPGSCCRRPRSIAALVPFVVLQVIGLAVVWAAPGLATKLPEQLFAATAPLYEDRAPATSPSAPAGSPVVDDFSGLLEEPAQRGQIPYLDDFENLLPDESHK